MSDPLYEEQRRHRLYAEPKQRSYQGSPVDAVRKHIGMYIGGNDKRAFTYLFRQLAEELIDTTDVPPRFIALTFRESGWICLEDDGLPIYAREPFEPSVAQECFTSSKLAGEPGLLHHLVVNALAAELIVDFYTGERHYRQTFHAGVPTAPPEVIGLTRRHGRTLQFRFAQDTFVAGADVVGPWFVKAQRELAALTGGLTIRLEDRRSGLELDMCYVHGLKDYLAEICERHELSPSSAIHMIGTKNNVRVEVACCWSHEHPLIRSFANRWQTDWGGTHVAGLWQGLARGITSYAREEGLVRSIPIRSSELKGHMACVVAVMLPKPLYEGCRKSGLASPEAQPAVARLLARALPAKLREQGLAEQRDLTYILRERFKRYSADGY